MEHMEVCPYWELNIEKSMTRLETSMQKDVQRKYFEWETSHLWNCLVTIFDRRLCNIIGNGLCDFGAVTLQKRSLHKMLESSIFYK